MPVLFFVLFSGKFYQKNWITGTIIFEFCLCFVYNSKAVTKEGGNWIE